MLDHCFSKVPYYQKLFAELGLKRSDFRSLEDLSRIPILSKEMLLEHHEEFKAGDFGRYRPQEIRTSGSTGTPMCVYWDIDSNVLELTCMWRHFSWSGYRLGQPFLDISSDVVEGPQKHRWNWKCRGLVISGLYVNESNIYEYAQILRKYSPRLWRGHPSPMYSFCRLLSEAGIGDVKPQYIYSHAESLLDYQRQFIEVWAGVPICDNYGLKEHNALICQCPEGGYHIASEYGIVEIVKDNGSPAQAGEEGRIVATGLHNKAFPLLRYDTGDYAVQSNGTCSCGRTLPLVERLIGRQADRLLTTDGKWVSITRFAFPGVAGIRRAQLVQEEPLTLDVYVVPGKGYRAEGEAILQTEYKKRLGDATDIRIHLVEEVPVPDSPKAKFIVCRLSNK